MLHTVFSADGLHRERGCQATDRIGRKLRVTVEVLGWLAATVFGWRMAIYLVGLAFFGGLTIYFLLANKPAYLPGVLLIDLGILSGLVRVLFFFDLSAHPTTPDGFLRIVGALTVISGAVLLERPWRRDRVTSKATS